MQFVVNGNVARVLDNTTAAITGHLLAAAMDRDAENINVALRDRLITALGYKAARFTS